MGEGSRGMQGDRRDNGDYFRLVGWRRWWGRGRGECRETSETRGTTFGWLGVASICPHCLACLGRFSLVGQLGDTCPHCLACLGGSFGGPSWVTLVLSQCLRSSSG